MMYYKIKLTEEGIKVLSKGSRKGKDKAGIMYVTQEELDRFNDSIVYMDDTKSLNKIV